MRIYYSRCKMNLKAVFVLLLMVLVIFGFSFYRYFYHQKYTTTSRISNAISSGKVYERDEALIEPLSMEMDKNKATTTETSTKESTTESKESNDMNFLPNTESEAKAKQEYLDHLDELARKQEMNITDETEISPDNETLLNEIWMKEYKLGEFRNTNSKTLVGKEKAGDDEEEDEIETNEGLVTGNRNQDSKKGNTWKKNDEGEKEIELFQENKGKAMSNRSDSFDNDFHNDTSRNISDLWYASKGRSRSNGTLQNLRSDGKTVISDVNSRKRMGKRMKKKNIQNILRQKIRSKGRRTRQHGNKKRRRTKQKSSLSRHNIHHKSTLHKEGHNGNRQQHKSINPNKKMLTKLKTNYKIDYREGFVLDETFFREAKLKPVYNVGNRKTSVLLLHPSVFTSSVWVNIGTMQLLAESGYRNIAIDLPGYGRSNSSKIPYSRSEVIDYMIQLLGYLSLEKPVIVTPSRSGDYVMPLLMSHPYMIGGFVAISPTDTGKYSRHFYENLDVQSLVVLGKEDTSMLNWASLDNLEHLKVRRIFTIANATKECYIDRPSSFHKLLLDFLRSMAIINLPIS